jgi:carboxyl-terminal processing protease
VPFYSTRRGFSVPSGQPLPTLGLARVTVLTGPDTCSASESVVNGLRGVGVTVNLVGGATCGKPYGFYPQDNCGTTYFAIQFKGVNQAGFGDYGDGFAPTCTVADDFDHQLGDKPKPGWPRRWRCAAAARAPRPRPRPLPGVGLDKAGPAAAEEQPEPLSQPHAVAPEPPARSRAQPGLTPAAQPRGKPLGHGTCHTRGSPQNLANVCAKLCANVCISVFLD